MQHALLWLCTILMAGCAVPLSKNPTGIQPFELRSFEQSFGYTQAVKVGNRIYVSGSVSMDKDGNTLGKGDMRKQVFHSYDAVRQSLAHYGANFSHVVKETIHTTDMDGFLKVSDERAKFYSGMRFPVSSWLGVHRLVSVDYLIEVEVEAVVPE